jgi:hypothetical protein
LRGAGGNIRQKAEKDYFGARYEKELMYDNHLLKIAQLVNSMGIEFVAPILKDKN